MAPTANTTPKLETYSDRPQLWDAFKGQVFGTIPAVTAQNMTDPDDTSRTIIITGSNSGLGLEAAKQFIQLGCVSKLILACRSIEKGEKAKTTLPAARPDGKRVEVEVWSLDMANTASIIAFADRAKRELRRIDVIVLNAGVDLISYQRVSQENGGYETTLMVNVVGTFLLAVMMVPLLREKSSQNRTASRPRIVVVGTVLQFIAKYNVLVEAEHKQSGEGILKWLSEEARWNGKIALNGRITEDRYSLSKGIVQLMVRKLARVVQEKSKSAEKDLVIVNCVCPGYCRTELFRDSGNTGSRIALRLVGRNADVGARALVIGAVGTEGGEGSHGGFSSGGKVKTCASWCETKQGERIGEQLWRELTDYIEEVQPGTMADL